MNETTDAEILEAAKQGMQPDEIIVSKLHRDGVLNLKAILEKLADSKPVQQEIQEIRYILDPLAEDFPIFVKGLASTIDHVQELDNALKGVLARLDALEEGKLHHSNILTSLFCRVCDLENGNSGYLLKP